MNEIDSLIQDRLFRHTCPTAEQLGEYELGLLAATDQPQIVTHLSACPHCSAELTTLRRVMALPLISAESTPASPLTKAKQFIINLLQPSDTALTPQLVLRDSGTDSGASVISHQIGDYLVTLSWQADVQAQDKVTLLADVTALDETGSDEFHGWMAHLWQQDKLIGQHPIGIDGDLLIDQLERSSYHLVVTGDDFEAHLQNLVLS